jgi:hypothetical protein
LNGTGCTVWVPPVTVTMSVAGMSVICFRCQAQLSRVPEPMTSNGSPYSDIVQLSE